MSVVLYAARPRMSFSAYLWYSAGGGEGDTRSSRFWLVFSSISHGHGHGQALRPLG